MKKKNNFTSQINCPIFSEYKVKIERLSQVINSRKISSQKIEQAQELLKIKDILSSCREFNEESDDCKDCRFALNIRGESARMIIEVSEMHL